MTNDLKSRAEDGGGGRFSPGLLNGTFGKVMRGSSVGTVGNEICSSSSSIVGKAVINSDSVRVGYTACREDFGEEREVVDVTVVGMVLLTSTDGGDDATEDVGEGGPSEAVETNVRGDETEEGT